MLATAIGAPILLPFGLPLFPFIGVLAVTSYAGVDFADFTGVLLITWVFDFPRGAGDFLAILPGPFTFGTAFRYPALTLPCLLFDLEDAYFTIRNFS